MERLFGSIELQTFKNFEVIVTDDSPDESVKNFLSKHTAIQNLSYHRNESPLGTPENWNEAIRKATGTWIKIMHDDDWFADANSLSAFADAALNAKDCYFIYSAYQNVYEDSGSIDKVTLSSFQKWLLALSPLNLFMKNFIGNPSCTMVRRDANIFYDNTFKWVVDFEYYIRFLRIHGKANYINQALINVGMNKDQVTKVSFRNPEVEIPENHLMFEKMGAGILRNVFVYDYYWRLYRNLGIRDKVEIRKYFEPQLPVPLTKMITTQKVVHRRLLKLRVVSKFVMLISYLESLFSKQSSFSKTVGPPNNP